ncbi:MAG: heme exporter protein CcmB [Bacteroidia bacterium]|nr:heme exporter protein CcmB [Bacteroidia bacterium]
MRNQVIHLIQKEILLEWRQKYAFQGLFLYVISTVFICYLSFRQVIDLPTWNALFWIIQLFAAVNAIARSFLQESRGRILYYYVIADARAVILAKMLYSLLLMWVLSVFNYLCYSLFIGNPVQDVLLFGLALLLGSMGFATVLSMVSAIASKAGNNSTLMAILSFPILMPLLMTTIRFSKNALDGLAWSVSYSFIIILIALNLLSGALAFLLFPYLWKD